MLNVSPPEDIGSALPAIGQSLASAPTPPPEAINVLASLNTFLNAAIGLGVTLLVLCFILYLIRWVIAPEGSEDQKDAARKAFRAFLATFLVVDIWAIVRVLQVVMSLSPVLEYLLFIGAFILLVAWSLFGITDSAIKLLGSLTDWVLALLVRGVQGLLRKMDAPEWSPGTWSAAVLRLCILLLIGILLLWFGETFLFNG